MATTAIMKERKQQHRQDPEKITELRISQTELNCGNTSGNIYYRLSEGAVAFQMERSIVKEDVSMKLRKELLKKEVEEEK